MSPKGRLARSEVKAGHLLQQFDEWIGGRFSPRTIKTYSGHARHFATWLSRRGLRFADVHHDDIQQYQGHLFGVRKANGQPLATGTVAFRLEVVRCLFRFLLKHRSVLFDPCTLMELPRVPDTLPRVTMTTREAKRIIERQEVGSVERAILEVLYATGVRVSELVALRPEDIDVDDRVVRVIQGKGAKDRNVPLTKTAAEAVLSYMQTHRQVFSRSGGRLFLRGSGPLNTDQVRDLVKRCARKAGIKKKITPHVFRHTVATHLLRNGADIRHIQAFLGHASLTTTERYTRVEVSDLRRVVEKAHPRGGRR
jgi:integrase/recombinase XerD